MTLIVPYQGQFVMLENVVRQKLTLRLYTNDRTPARLDKAVAYEEPVGNGYLPINLEWAQWEISTTPPITALYPEQIFTFTGGKENVYGYFVLHDTSGNLMWAERFANAPFEIKNEGDQIKVELTLKYRSS